MGMDATTVKWFCAAKKFGVEFDDVLTVGKQSFYPPREALASVYRTLGVDPGPDYYAHGSPNRFFEMLGARKTEAIDYSDYEGAEIIQDLNRPIPDELRNRWSVVFDGGSMEHVFFAGQALKSMMEMVRVGGWFIQIGPANNQFGHGFWQISPEVSFRALSPENGFDPPIVFLNEVQFADSWHAVRDPREVGGRVELTNLCHTYIYTLARKTADVEVFKTPPQQSDYVAAWEAEESLSAKAAGRGPLSRLPFRIPYRLQELAKWGAIATRARSAFDPKSYDHVSEEDLLQGRLRPRARA